MDNFLGTEYPEGKSREEFLEANCDAIENIGYTSGKFTHICPLPSTLK